MRPTFHLDHPLASNWHTAWAELLAGSPSLCLEGEGGEGGEGTGGGGAEDDLGDAGKKALVEERAAAKAAEKRAKEAEERAAAAEARAKELEEATASDADKALARAREEAAEAARADEQEKSAAVVAAANRRLVAAEARVQAVDAGVKPNRVDRFLKLLDTDDVEVDDDGKVDTKALRKLVDDELKATPEFKAAANGRGGFDGGARDGGATSGLDAGAARYRDKHPSKT